VKGLFEAAYGSRQHQGPAREFRSGLVNLEAEFLGELLNLAEIGRIGAVGVLVLDARHVLETGFFQGSS